MAIEYINGRYVSVPDYQIITAPNWSTPNTNANAFNPSASRLGQWFQNVRRGNFSDTLQNLNATREKLVNNPLLGQGSPSISNIANIGGGIYHGINALSGLNSNASSQKDLESLKRDITLATTNPMYDMYLNAADEKLLREMNNSNTSGNWTAAGNNIMNSIPQALLNAGLGFLTGNIPGAVIQGIGTLANAGIQGYGQGTEEQYNKLQGLYDKLQRANDDYRSMKRPRGLRQAGLQSQYFNQLY